MSLTIRSRSERPSALHAFLEQRLRSFALLFACALLMIGLAPRAHAGAEKRFTKESCSEFISGLQTGREGRADGPLEDTWISWTGTVVALDQTLWGSEVRVNCLDQPAGGGQVILSLDSQPPASLGLAVGKKIQFTGHLSGPVEDGHITIKDVEFVQEPMKASTPPPSAPTPGNAPTGREEPARAGARSHSSMGDVGAVTQQGIAETIQMYYQAVQMRQVDKAISLYAASKRPNIKRNVLESIARDTQYYAIDRIEVRELGPVTAKANVELRHKKLNKSEEYWEVWMELERNKESGASWRRLEGGCDEKNIKEPGVDCCRCWNRYGAH